ncbi:ABC transporter substrate-binding protein [Aquabacterium sp.]|uniref:ABC transporter substrate-binding protein n=1 Tax=Aquabacterium sp. TaxID=1872578 RepID=UPI002CC67C33|nr:ABC transporter substrate-binding protein [Aquabacterium sp.]HSW07326.1 ABC transporter substrate-binding protein [Aquabacterium sp.]
MAAAAAALGLASLGARAQAPATIKVGVLLSLSGPGASLGIPEKNTIEVLPPTLGGQPVRYIVLDDATDTVGATKHARRLVEEDKVDLIIGPTVTPTSLAALEVAGAAQTPMISLAGSGAIVLPPEGARRWAFKLAPNEPTMGAYIFDHLQAAQRKTLAYIGFNTAFGDSFIKEMNKIAAERGIKVLADERYAPNDITVAAQVLKVSAANPDAVIIAASGTAGALPVIELKKRGYKGQIYLQQGIANADFLRVGGRDLDGCLFPVSPVLVAEQLPASNPVRAVALDYLARYEGKFGSGSRSLFGATAWDAYVLLDKAVPKALAKAAPGTPEFRTALRDALEQSRDVVGAQGVFSLSERDHNGTDRRAQVLVRIESGKWVYLP